MTRPILVCVCVLASLAGRCGAEAPQAPLRIGTYDNRAIAVAYAPSRHNPVRDKHAERAAAEQAGDRARVAELERWGREHQRQLHFQGFGHAPVGDLLAHVRDGVARVAQERGLAAIAMECDAVAPGVELVDVTDDLVELFEPSERTRDMARKVRQAEPVPLATLAAMDERH